MKNTRFNKVSIESLARSGQPCTLKDPLEKGMRFKVGSKRCVFQYEKRIAGSKGAAVTFTIGPYPTYSIEEARQEARRLATLCEKGIDPRKPRNDGKAPEITLETAIGLFFEAKRSLRKHVIACYRSVFKNQFPNDWKSMQLLDITPEMIVNQFHLIHATSSDICWKYLMLMQNLWNTCSVIYHDEAGQPLLGANPVTRARQLLKDVRKPNPKRSVICNSSIGKFVSVAESISNDFPQGWPTANVTQLDRQMAQLCLLALFTGFRFDELRTLRWENVNLEKGFLFLPGEAIEGSEFGGTKNHHDHYIALSSYPWELLKRIYSEHGTDSPYVFPTKNQKGPCSRIRKVTKFLSQQIGSHFSPHTARRSFASIADEIGLGFLTVKRLLNHSFQGGVTGGYVVASFNPVKERMNVQKICDYILEQRAAHLGEDQESARIEKLRLYALELGLDPVKALQKLI